MTQPWCAYNAVVGGFFKDFQTHLDNIMVRPTPFTHTHTQGYFLDPTNIIFVVSEANLQRTKRFFEGQGLPIITDSHYMGGYLGQAKPQFQWLE